MTPRWRHLILAGLLPVLLTACSQTDPSPTAVPPTAGPPSATPSQGQVPTPSASPTSSPSPTESIALKDRPFTVLVLGADLEGRTDVIMVVGVDIKSRRISFASIPRDTINVPLPNGGTFADKKINSFYNFAAARQSTYPQGPARATTELVGGMLGIKIDFTARTTFRGFEGLTDAMGGVGITLTKAVVDPSYQVTTRDVGVSFPKGSQTLTGKRALIFVRTRGGDNDFERQRRQQAFLLAAGRQVLAKPTLVVALLAAQGNFQTDFPITQIPDLIGAITKIDGWTINQIVLGPRTYESAATCTCGYALEPKLDAMRKLARSFYPWAVLP